MQFSNINENVFDRNIETGKLKTERARNEFTVIVEEQILINSLTHKTTTIAGVSLIVGNRLINTQLIKAEKQKNINVLIILIQVIDLFALLLLSNKLQIERLNFLKGRHTPGELNRGQASSV